MVGSHSSSSGRSSSRTHNTGHSNHTGHTPNAAHDNHNHNHNHNHNNNHNNNLITNNISNFNLALFLTYQNMINHRHRQELEQQRRQHNNTNNTNTNTNNEQVSEFTQKINDCMASVANNNQDIDNEMISKCIQSRESEPDNHIYNEKCFRLFECLQNIEKKTE